MSTPAPSRPAHRPLTRAVAALALLLTCQNALAGSPLRRAGAGYAPLSPEAAAAALAAQQASAAAQAQAALRQANAPLRRALEAIREVQAAQDAARAAAMAAASSLPDGLGAGGLDVAEGGTWLGAAAPTQAASGDRTQVTVVQEEDTAILEWTTFNVGRETDLYFDQRAGGEQARDWIALNRVTDPAAAPSQILGSIRAEGQVYVLNRNGILFGGASQVNVSTLVASGLRLSQGDDAFRSGGVLTVPAGTPAFVRDGDQPAQVTVEAGARIEVDAYGQALLLGSAVENHGSILAPDGQVFLAAGDAVTLTRAEGNRRYAGAGSRVVAGTSGSIVNTGILSSRRGDVTLLAGQVRQGGVVTATTGAEANGSISIGLVGGTTTFGDGSFTQVLPDLAEEGEAAQTVIGAGTFEPSRVNVFGRLIHLEGGATVYAPGGAVDLGGNGFDRADDQRIYLAPGSIIDVSGLRGVEVAMERNTIQAELRANELRDNPVLRDGELRGSTVYFDARLGVDGVADLSGYYDLLERDVTELMVDGGTVTLRANEIIAREGSTIDLSGGSLRFLDGYVRSTYLVDAAGRRVRIEDAVAGERYVAIDGQTVVGHGRWGVTEVYQSPLSRSAPRFEAGYEQGGNAGTLALGTNGWQPADNPLPEPNPTATGAHRILDGTVRADVVVGPHQREAPGAAAASGVEEAVTRGWRERPAGATLALTSAGNVTVTNLWAPQLGPDFGVGDALTGFTPYEHLLGASWFGAGRFTQLDVASGFTTDATQTEPATANLAPGGSLVVGEGVQLDLGDGGRFTFSGRSARIDGAIVAPGGRVSLEARRGGEAESAIRLGSAGVIDVAGRWTDLSSAGTAPPRAIHGGAVTLAGRTVALEAGSLVDVSGGGTMDAAGKVTRGSGGSISLDVSLDLEPTVQQREAPAGQLALDGALLGFALGRGGSLSIATGEALYVGAALPAGAGPDARLIAPELFDQGGFASFSLLGERGVTVLAGTTVSPAVQSLALVDPRALETGARLADAAPDRVAREVLPESLRSPVSLTLSTVPARSVQDASAGEVGYAPDVHVEAGAALLLTPLSTLRLSALGTVRVDGAIDAPGGRIDLSATDKGLVNRAATPNVIVGAGAVLSARGWIRETPDRELVRRSVEGGGSIVISLAATQQGGAVVVEEGATLDVSGIRGEADLASGRPGSSRTEPVVVDGQAGSIAVRSPTGGLVAGDLRLAPGGPTGAGGRLEVISTGAPILVRETAPEVFAPGMLTVVAGSVSASGADELLLQARGQSASSSVTQAESILFEGVVDLHARRSITLATSMLGTQLLGSAADVRLSTEYFRWDGGVLTAAPGAFSSDTSGRLRVEAGLVDVSRVALLGCVLQGCQASMGGFGDASFSARGDLRLADYDASGNTSGVAGLFAPGSLELRAGQVYVQSRYARASLPADRSASDPGVLVSAADLIRVSRPEGATAPPPVPLSFGERLTLRAPVIEQGGVLRAPQGQIRLEGSQSVRLLPGSLTSVSLEGATVPFGAILAGREFEGYEDPGEAPVKQLTIQAPSVDVQEGAVVDVSGGGDLAGWRFSPGNGGSVDVLDQGGFAILPSLGSAPAPTGRAPSLRDPGLRAGDVVWLEGVPGLADGYYTLLPGHYALLPGGLYVRPLAGTYASAPDTVLRPDGSVVAAGYRAVNGTPIRSQGYQRFQVMRAEVLQEYSEYVPYSFNDMAEARALEAGVSVRTPFDAGSAAMVAGELALRGTGRFGAGEGGLLGNLDLSAPRIAVVGGGAAAPGDGYLVLEVESIEAFGAGSVLVGGVRSSGAGGTSVAVNASEVVVDTGGTAWTGPEILLAATGTVAVRGGSALEASGQRVLDAGTLTLAGDGALLRVSTGDRVGVVRTGASGAAGSLEVGAADVTASGSLTADGTRTVALSSEAVLTAAQFDLATLRLNLGEAPDGTPGTTLGVATVERLAASSDLLLRAYDSIHLYGALSLGAPAAGGATLGRLTLDTALVQGHASADQTARVTAGTLTLRNSGGVSQLAPEAGAGRLAIDVGTLALGPGEVTIAGFAAVEGSAGAIEGQGTGGTTVEGDLALDVGRIQAASGARTRLGAAGATILRAGTLPAGAAAVASLGGSFAVEGASVLLGTDVVMPAGSFSATARSGDLELTADASIDAQGAAKDFEDEVRFAPGGAVRLDAAGDLRVAAGARVDVSGSARGGDAGRVTLVAGGSASVAGEVLGSGAAGGQGGTFSIDAGAIEGFSALNAGLEAAGFDRSRAFRARDQDLTLGAGETLTAHHVVLRSDRGQVTVAGTIDASGTAVHRSGGEVELSGGNGVSVLGTAVVDASASAPAAGELEPASGSLEVVASGGRLDVAPGAILDVTGGRSGGGVAVFRAAREGNDVAVDRLAGELRARQVVVQGAAELLVAAGADAAPAVSLGLEEARTWLAASEATIRARLGGASLPGLLVAPALAVRSDGDLVIGSDVVLDSSLGAGRLAFEAGGDLRLAAIVSDGFTGPDPGARGAALGTSPSFSFSFEAGNDLVLANGSMVRTGTGDLRLVAGRDLVLEDASLAGERPAVVYTAGLATAPEGDFVLPAGRALPTLGGALVLSAGRDILAPLPRQTVSAWLFRDGAASWAEGDTVATATVAERTSWSVVHANFESGVGALGGGDVTVEAGRDVSQLQVSIPTTGHLTTPIGERPTEEQLHVRGGGDLELFAGRDVLGAHFVLGRGHAELRAGGQFGESTTKVSLRATPSATQLGFVPPRSIGLLLGLADATAEVTAAGGVVLEGLYDPMAQGQIAADRTGTSAAEGTSFSGYTERTALEVTSFTGTVTHLYDPWASTDLSRRSGSNADWAVTMGGGGGRDTTAYWFALAPPNLSLTSLEGSLELTDRWTSAGGKLTLASSPTGSLELVAGQDVKIRGSLEMGQLSQVYARGPLFPYRTSGTQALGSFLAAGTNELRGFEPLHAGDPEPVRIYARDGSVCAYRSGSCLPLGATALRSTLELPKPVRMIAGQDLMTGTLEIQHNGPEDLSLLRAGRDVYQLNVVVAGDGEVLVEAGRNYVQAVASSLTGNGGLIRAVGAGEGADFNAALDAGVAADVRVLAGSAGGVDLETFAEVYLDPANAAGVPRTYLPELAEYLARLGYEDLSEAELAGVFAALPRERRLSFLLDVYFEELRQTGIDYNDPESPRFRSYDRGFEAVARLFPGDPAQIAGDVLLDAKPLETRAGGDITVVAPYGRVQVGGESLPAGANENDGGVITRRGGDIRIMADGNVDLVTSRVFTLQGGDITMWTSSGSITAGAGSKTSVLSVPLRYLMSDDGVVTVDAFGLATGAGIGVLDAMQDEEDRSPSRLDLIAPRGEVNAGDAGIRVVGDLNIAAAVVVGLENIQVSGTSAGVPKIEVPALGALTSASAIAQAAAQEGVGPEAQPRTAVADLPSIITVEVVGYEVEKKGDDDRKKEKRN